VSRFGQAVVKIVGDESEAVASLKRLNASMEASEKQYQRDFGKIAGYAQKGALAFTAFGAAAAYGATQAVNAAVEAEKRWSRLGAMVKVNAGAVGRSLEDVRGLIAELRGTTLFDHTELEQSVSQLLTYKNIAGSTFERTIRLATDLSSVFGGLSTSTSALAKALDDPIRGLGDLRKQGFTFTAEVEFQIRAMMEQNKLFDAQRLILTALEGEVQGVASAMKSGLAKAMDDAKKSTNDAFEALGKWIGSFNFIESSTDRWVRGLNRIAETFDAMAEARMSYNRAVASDQQLQGMRWDEQKREIAPFAFRQGPDVRAALPGLAQQEADRDNEAARQRGLDEEARRTRALEAQRSAAEEAERHWKRAQAILAEMRFQERYSRPIDFGDPSQHIGRVLPVSAQDANIDMYRAQQRHSLSPEQRARSIAERDRAQGRSYDNRVMLERMDPARIAQAHIAELEKAERAAEQFGDVLVQAILSGSGAARSLAVSGGRMLMGKGMEGVVGWATSAQRGRAAEAAALAKGALPEQAAKAGGAAKAAAIAGGPAGLAIAGGGLALMLASNLFGRKSEDAQFRAHLRALREARKDEVVINLHLPGGIIDTTNPAWREAVYNTMVEAQGDRVGRLNTVGA
jgi:hypothetical protein